ncbi:hypothetical protein PRJ_Fausto_00380 [Faustovirus]|nr:hypothetical protein PRJ_Fausto_00380 [Faustovirus]AMN84302.1 hypothetical protein D5a_00402 [Faustovirus]QBR99285.1 hypothetical protein [Faustovirus mariensis]
MNVKLVILLVVVLVIVAAVAYKYSYIGKYSGETLAGRILPDPKHSEYGIVRD